MDSTLRQLQKAQLQLLYVFDTFCKEHDLHYSLYAGTLLGAVRHQGFIPWDDDLDVCMERPEYDRFLALWDAHPVSGYILQNKDNTPAFSQSFTKLRADHTTFLQNAMEAHLYHTGIFMDIFPLDRMPATPRKQRLFKLQSILYQLYTREFTPPKASFPVRAVSFLLLHLTPKSLRPACRKKLLSAISRTSTDRQLPVAAIETVHTLQKPFAPDTFDHFTLLPFENGSFMCTAKWHDMLTRKFGDYIQLPPEDERAWKHHPLILDFHSNLDELPFS